MIRECLPKHKRRTNYLLTGKRSQELKVWTGAKGEGKMPAMNIDSDDLDEAGYRSDCDDSDATIDYSSDRRA